MNQHFQCKQALMPSYFTKFSCPQRWKRWLNPSLEQQTNIGTNVIRGTMLETINDLHCDHAPILCLKKESFLFRILESLQFSVVRVVWKKEPRELDGRRIYDETPRLQKKQGPWMRMLCPPGVHIHQALGLLEFKSISIAPLLHTSETRKWGNKHLIWIYSRKQRK